MRHLKEILKKPVYFLLLILLVIIIAISAIFFYGLKKVSNAIGSYGMEISGLSDSLNKTNETIRQGFLKLNSAELLLNNANMILSTVYFGTADLGQATECKTFHCFFNAVCR